MCNPFFLLLCPLLKHGAQMGSRAGDALVDNVLTGLADAFAAAVEWVAELLTLWILVPSTDLCPTSGDDPGGWPADWVEQCNTASGPAQQLRGFLLPVTVLLAVGGLVWQGITIAITRRGEPLVRAVRGVWNTALWSAVGIAGAHLLLKAGDAYSMWLLNRAIFDDSAEQPDKTMSAALVGLLLPSASVAPLVMILISLVVLVVALVQTVLMVFREGSVVILAGLLQVAAAGSITRGTSPAFHKVLGWSVALGLYKPAACTVYATSFIMMRGNGRDFVMGLGMLALSVIALPVLMKFFTIFSGHVASGGGGLGVAGTAAATGLHAASSLRGAGGHSPGEHARYLENTGPGSGGPNGQPPSGAAVAPPSPMPGSAGGTPQVIDGRAVAGGTPGAAGPQTTVPAGTGASAAGPSAAAGTTAGAASAGASSAGSSAAAAGVAGSAAAGPAAPVVAGVVVAATAAGKAAAVAGQAAGRAMDEEGSR